jgi:hypothetical protein
MYNRLFLVLAFLTGNALATGFPYSEWSLAMYEGALASFIYYQNI